MDVVYTQTDAFDVSANMPAGTTKEQFAIMLQKALTERFNLEIHREDKPVQGYGLTVSSHGSKLQRLPEAAASNDSPAPIDFRTKGKDGFFISPPEYKGVLVDTFTTPGVTRIKFMRESMAEFAEWLAASQKRPVIDRTGLAGEYSFLLEFQAGSPTITDPSGPEPPADTRAGIFGALESTLGLKLVREPCQVKMLVIDHADRMPSAN